MEIRFEGVNYWAVLVAAVSAFILGGLWYAALFGKHWVRAYGYGEEEVKAMQTRNPAPGFVVMFVCELLTAWALAVLAVNVGVETLAGGVVLGLLVGVGIAATLKLTDTAAHYRPMGAFFVDASYQVLFLAVMGAIIGAWR